MQCFRVELFIRWVFAIGFIGCIREIGFIVGGSTFSFKPRSGGISPQNGTGASLNI